MIEQTEDFDFDKGNNDWQYLSDSFTTIENIGVIYSIELMIMYNGHPGVGYFDSISLTANSGTTAGYIYDANGNVQKYKHGDYSEEYTYIDGNRIETIKNSNNYIVKYEYYTENMSNLPKCETTYKITYNQGVATETSLYKTEYTYNSYGQVYSTKTTDCSDSNKYTFSYFEYSTYPITFGAVKVSVNEAQERTEYFYDDHYYDSSDGTEALTGRLKAVIYPDGNGVSYEYDAIGNMTKVLPAVLVTEDSEENGYTSVENGASVSYGYDSVTNRLNTIQTGSTRYTFTYDVYGNTESIKAGDNTLVSYEYTENLNDMDDYSYGNGKLEKMTYGNGLTVIYSYDTLDRIKEIRYNTGSNGAFETVYRYEYDAGGRLYSVEDVKNSEVTMYKYDKQGKLIGWYSYDSSDYTNKIGGTLIYDGESRITSNSMHFDYETLSGLNTGYILYSYSYDEMTDNLARMDMVGSWITGDIEPEYDYFGRTTEKVIDINQSGNAFYNKLTYSYKKVNGYETGLVSQLVSERRLGDGTSVLSTTTYNYTYDANGNITQITDANGVIQNKYYYDGLGQLIREDNKALNITWVYTYDNAGNITAKKPYSYSTGALGTAYSAYNFSYSSSDWGDKLTYGNYESILSYDAIGNPTNVFDGMSGYELTWQGRQLKSYQAYEDDFDSLIYGDTITFTYNADGIRTSKTVNGVKHEYHLNGSQIVFETWIEGNVEHFILYLYDETGAPIGLSYRNSSLASGVYHTCFFEKNLQGDIVAVYNSSGTVIGTYIYDAWGECTYQYSSAATVFERNIFLNYNPFRYRGYFYDVETELYYLQTRYYNPSWCRFINADGIAFLGANKDLQSYNLYAYCSNNPVMNIDPFGTLNWLKVIGAVATVAAISVVCAATAGSAAVLFGASAVVAKTAFITTAAVTLGTGGVAISNQISETGDITDFGGIVLETAEAGASTALDTATSGASLVLKMTAMIGITTSEVMSETIANMNDGMNFDDALNQGIKSYAVASGMEEILDNVLFPHAMDVFSSAAKLLFPDKD